MAYFGIKLWERKLQFGAASFFTAGTLQGLWKTYCLHAHCVGKECTMKNIINFAEDKSFRRGELYLADMRGLSNQGKTEMLVVIILLFGGGSQILRL